MSRNKKTLSRTWEAFDALAPAHAVTALFVFSFFVLAVGSDSYSQVTRGDVHRFVMRASISFFDGMDWLVAHMGRWRDFSKPPLFHWLSALSMLVFGSNPLAFRLPGLLFASGTVALTFLIARDLGLSKGRSLLASMLWLSSAALWLYGRQPLLESAMTFFMLFAYRGAFGAWREREARGLYWFGAGAGLSGMVKWGVGPLSLGLFFVVYFAKKERFRWLLKNSLHVLGAGALGVSIASAWPLWTALSENGAFFLGQLHTELFADRFKVPTSLGDFFLKGVLLGTLPWTFFLVPAILALRGLSPERRDALGAWVVGVMLPIFLISSRTSRYAFPALPAFAILVAVLWDGNAKGFRRASRATGVLFGVAVTAPIGASLSLGLSGGWGGLFLIVAALFGIKRFWQARPVAALGGVCAVWMILLGMVVSRAGFHRIPERVLNRIAERPVGRYLESPDSAGTGYLPLQLGRTVYGYGPSDFPALASDGGLWVASGDLVEHARVQALQQGFETETLESWESPRTNPLPDQLLESVRAGSLEPLAVEHRLMRLRSR